VLSSAEVPLVITVDVPNATGDFLGTSLEGINMSGTVVGNLVNGTLAFQLSQGVLTAIACPGATGETVVAGINTAGVLTVWCRRGDQVAGWRRLVDGTFHFLTIPGAVLVEPRDIAAADAVVGDYRATDGTIHGFFAVLGLVLTLDVPGAQVTAPTGINTLGQVVGFQVTNTGSFTGWLLDGGAFTPVAVPGANATLPMDISDQGVIVGIYNAADDSAHSFVLENGVYHTLAHPHPEVLLLELHAIQGRQVLGSALVPGATPTALPRTRGVLLVLPETLPVAPLRSEPARRTERRGPSTPKLTWHLTGCPGVAVPTGAVVPAKLAGRGVLCKK
jgi:hypothetical protein